MPIPTLLVCHKQEEKIDAIKSIVPEAFTEGELDVNELNKMFNNYIVDVDSIETYKFSWWGKERSKQLAYLPVTQTLKPKKADSKNFKETKNLYIESDNLAALKILRDSYASKVKMIYIDPPYNTGNDFIYEDDYREPLESYKRQTGLIDNEGRLTTTEQDLSGRKHTNWLNMMYPRLLLARDFLSEDGVIFISIDDIELANMRKICDEIFGGDNLVSNSVRVSNSAKNNADFVSDTHDYTLIYAKNIEELNKNWSIPKNNHTEFEKRANRLLRIGLSQKEIEEELKELVKYPRFYDFDHFYYVDEKGVYQTGDPGVVKNGNFETKVYHPVTKKECKIPSGGWRNKPSTMKRLIKDHLLHFGEDENTIPRIKRYLKDNLESVPRSINFFDTQSDTKRWKNEGIYFDFPKPVEFIKQLLRMATFKDSIVMDFFSGSATTAEAVMELNSEDGGCRRFIMVQLPEDLEEQLNKATSDTEKRDVKSNVEFLKSREKPLNLSELGKERIRIAGEGIISDKPELKETLDTGFKVFEYDDTNFPIWDENVEKDNLNKQFQRIIDGVVNHEEAIYEILLLLKTFELTDCITQLDESGLYLIDEVSTALVYLGNKMRDDVYQRIIQDGNKYDQIIIFDNSLDDKQKQNIISSLGKSHLEFI